MQTYKLTLATLLFATGSAHAQFGMEQMMAPMGQMMNPAMMTAPMGMMAPMMAPMGQMMNPAMMAAPMGMMAPMMAPMGQMMPAAPATTTPANAPSAAPAPETAK